MTRRNSFRDGPVELYYQVQGEEVYINNSVQTPREREKILKEQLNGKLRMWVFMVNETSQVIEETVEGGEIIQPKNTKREDHPVHIRGRAWLHIYRPQHPRLWHQQDCSEKCD